MTDIPESPFAVHALQSLALPPQQTAKVRELAQVVALTSGDYRVLPSHILTAALMAGEVAAVEMTEIWR